VVANGSNWWHRAPAIARELHAPSARAGATWYRFGRSSVVVDCEDLSFSRRFRDIFAECAVEPTGDDTPRVDLRVKTLASEPELLAISVTPALPDGVTFLRQLLPDRSYTECDGLQEGWRMLAPPEAPDEPVLAFGPSEILVSRRHPWQHVVAMYAISSAFRMQPDLFLFHAASVGVFGKGILLSGPKGAGKTTLALTLASRDHAFLGDEWAAVSASTGELLPLRRVASIRPGPHPKRLDEYLRHHVCHSEVLPDGTERVRARVGAAFPRAYPQVVSLADIFFLRRFSSRPAVEPFARNGKQWPPVSPLLASLWGHSPGQRTLDLLRTVNNARWWHLDVGGSPEETTELVEETIKENLWH
jgi:hypothetical protein